MRTLRPSVPSFFGRSINQFHSFTFNRLTNSILYPTLHYSLLLHPVKARSTYLPIHPFFNFHPSFRVLIHKHVYISKPIHLPIYLSCTISSFTNRLNTLPTYLPIYSCIISEGR